MAKDTCGIGTGASIDILKKIIPNSTDPVITPVTMGVSELTTILLGNPALGY